MSARAMAKRVTNCGGWGRSSRLAAGECPDRIDTSQRRERECSSSWFRIGQKTAWQSRLEMTKSGKLRKLCSLSKSELRFAPLVRELSERSCRERRYGLVFARVRKYGTGGPVGGTCQ